MGYDFCIYLDNAELTVLQQRKNGGWSEWMVDSPKAWYGMGEFALRTVGENVLIGGLGLGLIIHHLHNRRDIKKVTVVEISPEVIEMISPYLPQDSMIEIIQGDFFTELPSLSKTRKFNTIIVDIWAGVSFDEDVKKVYEASRILLEDYYPEATPLFHGFQKPLDNEASLRFIKHVQELEKEKRKKPRGDLLQSFRKFVGKM